MNQHYTKKLCIKPFFTLNTVVIFFRVFMILFILLSCLFYAVNPVKAEHDDTEETTSKSKVAYITIDDGPSEYTEQFLDLFDKYNVKVTFFMLDGYMRQYPNIVKEVIKKGHSIGLHGVTHDARHVYASLENVINEMEKERITLQTITGIDTTLIRTPYGSKPFFEEGWKEAIQDIGYQIWDWNIDSEDWVTQDERMVENVINDVKKLELKNEQPVILFHDTKATSEHIEAVIVYLLDQGFDIRSIDDSIPPFTW
ncbi:polysaccharide deacetylase family protein [Cytobacillus sp. IB215316]|uniref:polysaccharide deacetylase family protein n=1 Tax=Cytobacillus sp. IB215316 TaxID=3097354 RepID=UPI002A1056A1|nr:polysaccharide deacetylase family protein [Cytobacillus sp. IB215316]MDX8362648.1 polysaccharide deacetylase family protein [Cytobacillus sp. IB215316]